MNQQQSIGSNNQQKGLPEQRHQQAKPGQEKQISGQPAAPNDQQENPLVTDDAGNPVNKKTEEAGKGYSEVKQTESYSDVKPHDDQTENKSPVHQAAGSEKVYGAKTDSNQPENLPDHNFTEQYIQEDKEAYEKRIRQSGSVAG
ncbi:hypothetical protein BH10BAC3_BH10BAC3_07460 [soil metagenome]